MKCKVPEISWHNREPVLSVDLQVNKSLKGCYRLATGGSDCYVLVWNLTLSPQTADIDLHLVAELGRHQRSVNVVRWSPNGELLASGDDESVIFIWKQKLNELSNELVNDSDKEIWTTWKVLRGHLEDVYDISWSPDSQFLISGSVDNSAIVWNVNKGISIAILNEHKGFVQGVAWDPKNQLIVTLSSDRYMRIYDVQTKRILYRIKKGKLPIDNQHNLGGYNVPLFHDDTLQTFFRRLCFTPDGKLLLTPAGIREYDGNVQSVHTTYVFNRFSFFEPTIVLPSQDQYTVAIRCCPTLFSLRPYGVENPPIIDLPYRIIYAVASRSSVYFYDTQQRNPFALVSNIHYTRLTDLSWSHDGRILIVSSTDGFCSIISFESNELGEIYEKSEEVLNKMAINAILLKKSKKKFKENQLKKKKKMKFWKKCSLAKNNTTNSFSQVIENNYKNNHNDEVYGEKIGADLKVNTMNKDDKSVQRKYKASVTDVKNDKKNVGFAKDIEFQKKGSQNSEYVFYSNSKTTNFQNKRIKQSLNPCLDQKQNYVIESICDSKILEKFENEVGDMQPHKPLNVNETENLSMHSSNINNSILDEKTPRRVALKTISTPKSTKKCM